MEVVVFGADRRPGLLIDGDVVDVCTVSSEIPRTLEGFIRGGKGVLEQAHECAEIALERSHEDVVRSATLAELHAPWPGRRIACAGANYAEHVLGIYVNLLGRSGVTIDKRAGRVASERTVGILEGSRRCGRTGGRDPDPLPYRLLRL